MKPNINRIFPVLIALVVGIGIAPALEAQISQGACLALLGSCGDSLEACLAGSPGGGPIGSLDLDTEPTIDDYPLLDTDGYRDRVGKLAAHAVIAALADCGEGDCAPLGTGGGNYLRDLCAPGRQYLPDSLLDTITDNADAAATGAEFFRGAAARCAHYMVGEAQHCTITRQRSTRAGTPGYSLQAPGARHPAASICKRAEEHWPSQQVLEALFESRPAPGSTAESVDVFESLAALEFDLLALLGRAEALGLGPDDLRAWVLEVIASGD